MYEFKGTVTKILDARTVGTKGRLKREFRVKELPEGKFPNIVPFILKGDRCRQGDTLSVGDEVKVTFVLEGNEWDKHDGSEPRCFCSNVCLKLEVTATASTSSPDGQTEFDQSTTDEMPF